MGNGTSHQSLDLFFFVCSARIHSIQDISGAYANISTFSTASFLDHTPQNHRNNISKLVIFFLAREQLARVS